MTACVYSDISTTDMEGLFSSSGVRPVRITEDATANVSHTSVRRSSWLSLAEHSRLTMQALGGAVNTPPEVRRGIDRALRSESESVPAVTLQPGDRRRA